MAQSILSTSQMRAAEARAADHGVDTHRLMANAGQAAADYISERYPQGRILVACGPGNNGGDGMVAACALADIGYDVHVIGYGHHPSQAPEAARAHAQLVAAKVPQLTKMPDDLSAYTVIVDALFGAGLTRPLDASLGAWFAQWRRQDIPVVALDIPSGLDADKAYPLGDIHAPATATIAFAPPRPAHYVMPACQFIGQLHIADIGIPPSVITGLRPQSWLNEPSQWQMSLPRWGRATHKYHRGALLILAGPVFHTGATCLSALAAFHIGIGLVTLVGSPRALATAKLPPEVMLAPIRARWQLYRLQNRRRAKAILLGPGFAGSGRLGFWRTRRWVQTVLRLSLRVVLDADALSAFAHRPARLLAALRAHAHRTKAPAILTPHSGEFARLFPHYMALGRWRAAQAAARDSASIIVLKGADTLIAAPDGRCFINTKAPPTLSIAGSGDVLAGLCAGLYGQGMDGFHAAAAAVWLHGMAGQALGSGLLASDLAPRAAKILAELLA